MYRGKENMAESLHDYILGTILLKHHTKEKFSKCKFKK